MRPLLRKVARGVAFIVIVLFLAWLGRAYWVTVLYEAALPEELETVGFARAGSDWSVASLVTRSETCGAAVFQLSDLTQKRINDEGIEFFSTALEARGVDTLRFEAWRETPVPREWLGDGTMAAALHCADFVPIGLVANASTVGRVGGYYTTSGPTHLVVMPGSGLILLTVLEAGR